MHKQEGNVTDIDMDKCCNAGFWYKPTTQHNQISSTKDTNDAASYGKNAKGNQVK